MITSSYPYPPAPRYKERSLVPVIKVSPDGLMRLTTDTPLSMRADYSDFTIPNQQKAGMDMKPIPFTRQSLEQARQTIMKATDYLDKISSPAPIVEQ